MRFSVKSGQMVNKTTSVSRHVNRTLVKCECWWRSVKMSPVDFKEFQILPDSDVEKPLNKILRHSLAMLHFQQVFLLNRLTPACLLHQNPGLVFFTADTSSCGDF